MLDEITEKNLRGQPVPRLTLHVDQKVEPDQASENLRSESSLARFRSLGFRENSIGKTLVREGIVNGLMRSW